MSILNDIVSKRAKNIIKIQQQPEFPLRYDKVYGPYSAITSLERSYQRNFMNLLLTSPGEWPMSPDMGVGLKHFLFEFENSEKMNMLKSTIQEQLRLFLPEIEIVDVLLNVADEDLSNKASLIIHYSILKSVGLSTQFMLSLFSGKLQISEIMYTQVRSLDLLNRSAAMVSSLTTA